MERRRRWREAETMEGIARVLGRHCALCEHFCAAGCRPDLGWFRVWLREVGGDPLVVLALDCPEWRG